VHHPVLELGSFPPGRGEEPGDAELQRLLAHRGGRVVERTVGEAVDLVALVHVGPPLIRRVEGTPDDYYDM